MNERIPSDLCFRRGGGSGLELEVEAACVGEGFTGLAGSIELRRAGLPCRRTGGDRKRQRGCVSSARTRSRRSRISSRSGTNFVLDPRVHIGLDPDSPSLGLLLLLRDFDVLNVRVEELFRPGVRGCGYRLVVVMVDGAGGDLSRRRRGPGAVSKI